MWEFLDAQVGFRNGRGTRDQIANLHWMIKKQGNPRKKEKKILSASLTTLKALTVWITTNCGKLLKLWDYSTTFSVSWETSMQVKKQWLEPYMEQMTGSNLVKEYGKAVYCHPVYVTSMQNTLCKTPGWVTHKVESHLPGEISTTSHIQKTPL